MREFINLNFKTVYSECMLLCGLCWRGERGLGQKFVLCNWDLSHPIHPGDPVGRLHVTVVSLDSESPEGARVHDFMN